MKLASSDFLREKMIDFFNLALKLAHLLLARKCSERNEEAHFALMHSLIEMSGKDFPNLSHKAMSFISTSTGLVVVEVLGGSAKSNNTFLP